MKKTINLAILLLLVSHLLTAQNNPNKGQKNGERREKMAVVDLTIITALVITIIIAFKIYK